MIEDTDFRQLAAEDATDLHLTAGKPAVKRIGGVLVPFGPEITENELRTFAERYVPPERLHRFTETGSCDSAFSADPFRCRLHLYLAGGQMSAAIRLLPSELAGGQDPDQDWISSISSLSSGLVLVTGPTGSGKTTTLARIAEQINETRACHIITLEDPVEYIFPSQKALIHQREIGTDASGWAPAIRDSLREDPDVIVIGELRDSETIAAALSAAETGHLVLGTLHNRRAPDIIGRIVHAFPAEKDAEIRLLLSVVLRTAAAQTLLRFGKKTVPVREILTNTPAVSHLIREGKDEQIHAYMELRQHSMRTMKQAFSIAASQENLSSEDLVSEFQRQEPEF